MRRVYLDNNATTPVLPEVLDAMRPYFGEHFGNASSIHHHGQETRAAVERARDSVADLLGCQSSEIVFTSGGTEGDNLAIAGLTEPRRSRHHLDHRASRGAATLASIWRRSDVKSPTFRWMAAAWSIRMMCDGRLRPNTKLISIMMANNETGVLQPVEEIGKIADGGRCLFHTDAVQAAGKVPIDVKRIGCDALSISGHKMHAPQGVGALYVRKGTQLRPLFYGGSHERSRRAGTENVPGIVALGKAAELAMRVSSAARTRQYAALRDRLQQGILAQLKHAGVNGEGRRECRIPRTFISITSKVNRW